MADVETDVAAGQPKMRTFKKFSHRGVDPEAFLDKYTDELVKLLNARPRRRFQRGLKRKQMALIKLRKADGVILGADTRATAGSIVADKNCEKIHCMAPNIYCCGAGTAADTETVTDMISSQPKFHRFHTGRESIQNLELQCALHELKEEFQLNLSDEVKFKRSTLESELITEKERFACVLSKMGKDRKLQQEREKKFDLQYQRTIAEALDNHLTALKRDHEQIYQLEERRIRDDAAREEAKRKEKALQEEKLRLEKMKAEEEDRIKAEMAERAKAAAVGAEKIAAQKAAAQRAAESVIRASKNALELEKQRKKIYDALSANNASLKASFSQDYHILGQIIGRQIKTISATRENIITKAGELVNLINSPGCPQSIGIQLFAEKIVSNCANQKSLNTIFAISRVIVLVTSKIPEAMDILIAELNKVCIYTTPKHISYSKEVYNTKDAYLKAIGCNENAKMESIDDFVERLSCYMRLYGALVQAEFENFQNLHGLTEGWAWLARFLNMVPANLFTAVALHSFLEMAGFSLYRRYKSQFQKLLHIIARDFLSSLKEGGSESRSTKMSMVKMSIRNYVESNQFMKEPEGWRLRDHLESNEFW